MKYTGDHITAEIESPESTGRKNKSAGPSIYSTEQSVIAKYILQFLFTYFIIQIVPLTPQFYSYLISVDWLNIHFADIFNLAHYTPKYFSVKDRFSDWLVSALIAGTATIGWNFLYRKEFSNEKLYYYLRVILRYRLAAGIAAYGFLKFFPLQAPYPSLSLLNSNYGDLTAWKIFSLSLGAAPKYEIFLGLTEIIAAVLLLYRKTASIGAFIIICFTGNVFLTNLAYEGGEYVYSLYLVSIALVIFAYDAPRLFTLLSLEKPAEPNRFRPDFSSDTSKYLRLFLKSSFIFLFIFIYGIKTYSNLPSPYPYPETPGLQGAAGIYNVSEFTLNGKTLPYSNTNKDRWKDVVFETWATISIKSNRAVWIDPTNTEVISRNDSEKNYEVAGIIGRHFYHYEADTVNRILKLKNKNINHSDEKMTLKYERQGKDRIILTGVNEKNDSIKVVLERFNKKYLLKEGRRKAQTL
jgi:hypothetical protein